MCYGGDFDWRKEVFVKVASFGVIPCESILMKSHEVMHEFAFFRKEEARRMTFVNNVASFGGITAIWCEWRGMWRKDGEIRKWITFNVMYNAKLLRDVGIYWTNLLHNWFIFLCHECRLVVWRRRGEWW